MDIKMQYIKTPTFKNKIIIFFLLLPAFFVEAEKAQLPLPFFANLTPSKVFFQQENVSVKLDTSQRIILNLPNVISPLSDPSIELESVQYINENYQVVFQTILLNGHTYVLHHSQGKSSAIGELIGNSEHWYYQSTPDGTWITDINSLKLTPSQYENDTKGKSHLDHSFARTTKKTVKVARSSTNNNISNNEYITVDVMLLFTPNIITQFPGELSDILLNHLIAKTNQAFVNSNINVQLRLVRSDFVDYKKESNIDAIDDLEFALGGDFSGDFERSLQSVRSWRDTSGADIVAMIRTHDLNERVICGAATFPNRESDILVNISNVGISGGSNCSNTFTHEIGHNFGAGHQAMDGQSQGALSNSGALIVRERFNTMMSSIGTGDDNRNFKLNVFSNLDNQCGGINCGNVAAANNAATIEAFALQNAALREPVIPIDDAFTLIKTFPDNDGDGSANNIDAFPFDASEQLDSDNDSVGDLLDTFPFDSSETIDTDNDGIGNNEDTDDDNDGIDDNVDALPLNRLETIDNDGDGVGANVDALDSDFQETDDFDLDGIGNLQDLDDDNDGVNDYFKVDNLQQTNMLIVSANSNQVLEYDATTGDFISVAFSLEEGSLSYRSDIEMSLTGQVYFIAQSDVYRFDRQSKNITEIINRSELSSNFPAHLTALPYGSLLVSSSVGFSVIQWFDLTPVGYTLTFKVTDGPVYRDTMVISNNRLLVAVRDENVIKVLDLNDLNSPSTNFIDTGLNKPEQLALDTSGNIYVTNAGSASITKYDANGRFITTLISSGEFDLGRPSCIAIGPDGFLYVCSADTNEVFQFDTDSGAFISKIITAQSGGLDRPLGIAFVGKPLDAAPFDPNNDSDNDGTGNQSDAFPLDFTEDLDTDNDGIGNNADTDDDNDKMPDIYEIQFTLDPLNAVDANQDNDGDGASNLAEFLADTNPLVSDLDHPMIDEGGGGSINYMLILLLLTITFKPRRYFH